MCRRNAFDIDIAFRDSGGRHESASFNVVADDGVFGAAEMFHAVNGEHGRADALNVRAHCIEEPRQIADVRFARCAADNGCPLCQRRRHHHVRCRADARAVLPGEIHLCAD